MENEIDKSIKVVTVRGRLELEADFKVCLGAKDKTGKAIEIVNKQLQDGIHVFTDGDVVNLGLSIKGVEILPEYKPSEDVEVIERKRPTLKKK